MRYLCRTKLKTQTIMKVQLEITVHSPMMKSEVTFHTVSDMVTFLSSQFAIVPSYYGDSVTLDTFRISVLPTNLPNVFSMSIPVEANFKKTLDNVISWMRAIDKMNY